MVVIVGCIVVLACVLGGFTLSGGHIGALVHPAEILTIGGAATGLVIPDYPTLPPYNPIGTPGTPIVECPTPLVDTTNSNK